MKNPLCIVLLALALAASAASAQPVQSVLDQAKVQKEPFLATLRQLVEIESGSYDRAGLDRIAEVVATRLRGLGGQVEVIETPDAEITRTERTPARLGKMVRATFKGKGTRSVLLIAHMDTVYEKGQGAQQPFRIDGNRVYGLGIFDDKQGVALIIHAVASLQALKFDDFGTLTVLINGDEEVGSPASRKLITAMGKSHDATMSFEGSSVTDDRLSLTTAGIGSVKLTVRGRASHAGSSPHLGVNALYELAHQIMQMRDLSDPATGTKLNWTLAKGGTVINMITPEAEATADVRVLKVEEYKVLEAKIQERIKNQLLPEARVTAVLTQGRPPLVLTPASRALAEHSRRIFREIGQELKVEDTAVGGGTDAAFAALEAGGKPVVERYGLQGFGAHSANAEYVALDSIEPRLYLTVRTIMDIAQGKVRY
ncbi:MAG: M20/M25/M40 family metallo-hydrolase [Ramlibacter sp.]|nr:M20/M25/M40 family metallo-hydrolase [Ramlibacter sp.]